MFGKSDQRATNEREILGDVDLAEVAAAVSDLAAQVASLEDQLRSQYTSVATYASIATEQVEFARNEARSDLERTKSTLIDLMERLRAEVTGDAPRAATSSLDDRAVQQLSRRVDGLENAITRVLERQHELASMLADILELTSPSDGDDTIADLALL